MEQACKIGHLSATDLADYLVQKQNMPFRTAYYITKSVVACANELKKDMSELSIEEIQSSCEELQTIDEEILEFLNLRNSMNARNSFGGTSSKQTQEQIEYFQKWLQQVSSK
jgi:argininosuccinate lyase